MRARRLTFFFLMYVSLDLSSPFIPGAFNFNPDESIDGIDCQRDLRIARLATSIASRPFADPSSASLTPSENVVAGARCGGNSMSDWLVDVRRAHAPVPEVSALSDDH